MTAASLDLRESKRLYCWVSVVGTAVSLVMALTLLFAADKVIAWFHVGGDPITWTQLSGELLTLVSIFYIPAIINLDRFRPHAWIGATVARGTICLLCVVGVVAYGAPLPFLGWAAVELVIGAGQVILLFQIQRAESGRTKADAARPDGGFRALWHPLVPTMGAAASASRWKRIYCWVAWIGIAANSIFVLPLVFAPHWMLRLLGVEAVPVIWAQMAGLLLGLVSVFYIPATMDPDRYRPFAWLAIFPSRSAGVLFCTVAVLGLGANDAFLLGVSLDLPFAVLQTFILARLAAAEHFGEPGWGFCVWRKWWQPATAVLAAVAILGSIGWHKLQRDYPQQLADDSIQEYFKHGSNGTEQANGLPYWIWLSLPSVFPEYLPKPGGYAALGFQWEPGAELPIGFSRKKIGFDRIGITCALCHAGSVQVPGEPYPRCYLGAPTATANILGYQRFLFACANDPRFNAATLMPAIGRLTRLSLVDNLLYRFALIPATAKALRQQSKMWEWTYEKDRPEWGPGRIEPFNPVKVAILQGVDPKVKVGATLGTSDMEPLWTLGAIPGRAFHWDGLNTDLREVVDSSALGDGALKTSIPRLPPAMAQQLEQCGNSMLAEHVKLAPTRLRELEAWIMTNTPPRFPFSDQLNTNLLARGAAVYQSECARCHAPGSEGVGKVMAASGSDGVGTDDNRAKMWTAESAAAYNAYLGNLSWRFSHFRSTGGYVNVPLDGLWLRAPYLHNGSVPSLADLLKPVAQRPKIFWRGLNEYDPVHVGYVSDGPEAEACGFRYDTAGRGNGNQGHLYGTTLPEQDKAALLEYLKEL